MIFSSIFEKKYQQSEGKSNQYIDLYIILTTKMQMLSRMNAKLNVGWKMTNLSCPKCCGTTLAEPSKQINTLYCPKEDKLYPYEPMNQQAQQSSEQEDTKTQTQTKPTKVIQVSKPSEHSDDDFYLDKKSLQALEKTNDVSKLIGQKLLQGWTMLNESCDTCYSPIMKSKKQEKICFGCNTNYTKPAQKKPKEQSKIQVSPSKPIVEQKQIIKSSISTNIPKTQSVLQNSDKSAILERIHTKSLSFIEGKIDKAIADNDLGSLQRALSLVSQIRSAFN